MGMKRVEGVRGLGAVALMIASVVGCQKEGEALIAVAPNVLGITHVEVGHRTEDGERILDVRGLDENGQELAIATLRTGMVRYPPQAKNLSAGTELDVWVGEASQNYVSPDREPHQVSESLDASIVAFTRLEAVSSAIMDEAGIWFSRRPAEGEVGFPTDVCDAANYPTGKGVAPSCCMRTGAGSEYDIFQIIPSGYGAGNVNKLAHRTRLMNNNVCRKSDGTTGCAYNGTPCYYGPCAAHIVTVPSPNTASAKVFNPTTGTCAADSNGSSSGGGLETPEPYSAQSLRESVADNCSYAVCRSDGVPGNLVTLVADCSGSSKGYTNSVYIGSNSVSCSGTQRNSQQFFTTAAGTQVVQTTIGGSGVNVGFGSGCPGFSTSQGVVHNLNESSGTTANDSLGTNDTATLQSSASFKTSGCFSSNCVDTGHSDGWVSLSSTTDLNFAAGSAFSITTYFKTADHYGRIFSMRSSSSGAPVVELAVGHIGVEDDSGNLFAVVRDDNGALTGLDPVGYVKGGVADDNVWHKVELRRGNSGWIELLLDDVSQGTGHGTNSGGAITTDKRRLGSDYYWETQPDVDQWDKLDGFFDEVSVKKDCILSPNGLLSGVTVEADFTP